MSATVDRDALVRWFVGHHLARRGYAWVRRALAEQHGITLHPVTLYRYAAQSGVRVPLGGKNAAALVPVRVVAALTSVPYDLLANRVTERRHGWGVTDDGELVVTVALAGQLERHFRGRVSPEAARQAYLTRAQVARELGVAVAELDSPPIAQALTRVATLQDYYGEVYYHPADTLRAAARLRTAAT